MLIDYKYVYGTFEPEYDVEGKLGDDPCYKGLLEHIKENDLMDSIVSYAVDWLRDWVCDFSGDQVWAALDYAIEKNTGKKLAEWDEA